MPRRWLSVRGRKEAQRQVNSTGQHRKHDFNFDFTPEPEVLNERHESAAAEVARPTTSGGERYRSRRKPDLTLLIERPKSSDSMPHNKTPLSARFDGSQIGLAFGSPRHPPEVFRNIDSAMSLTHEQSGSAQHGPLPAQDRGKKWKIGSLFRTKSNLNKETFYQVQPVGPETKLGLPIQRTPWRNPKSPPVPLDESEVVPPPLQKDSPRVTFDDLPVTDMEVKQADHTLPMLQVSIPGTPLERYSVMFQNVNGAKQSGLLVRRSKGLEQLVISEVTKTDDNELVVPKITRRATSPTTTTSQGASRYCDSGLNGTKYSLFPATPTSLRCQTPTGSPRSCRNRSATAPSSRSASIQQTQPKAEVTLVVQPQASHAGKQSADSRASTGPAQSTDSRVSSQSEIFFDVKSFRDSSGHIGHQYEMTRPPSAAVQLARSQSNARKLQQGNQNNGQQDMSETTAEDPVTQTSLQIDETIAMIETLTSRSLSTSSGHINLSPSSQTQMHEPKRIESESLFSAMDTASVDIKKPRRRSSLKTRIEGLNIDVPSPVLEAAEEATPRRPTFSESVEKKERSITSSHPLSTATRTNMETSSRLSAVSVKDSHHIPLSKYAPRHTTEDLVRQTGLRPVRSVRSNTADNTNAWNPRSSSLQRPGQPTRSATVPLPNKIPQSKQVLTTHVIAGPGANGTSTNDMPSMVAFVKPAAEVAIARTISLSRKPSAKVLVGRPVVHPGRTNSVREKAQEDIKEKKVALGVPVVQEVHNRHKPGVSLDVVLETATIVPTTPPPAMPSQKIANMEAPSGPPPSPPSPPSPRLSTHCS